MYALGQSLLSLGNERGLIVVVLLQNEFDLFQHGVVGGGTHFIELHAGSDHDTPKQDPVAPRFIFDVVGKG